MKKNKRQGSYLRSSGAERHANWALRVALAVVYVWFGLLKVLGVSPATQLVRDLFDQTLAAVVPFNAFFTLFSWFEVVLGIMFLVPRLTRAAFILALAHLISTAMPLLLLPDGVWSSFLVPTLEGQYIIKNVLILAAAFVLLVRHERARS